MTVGDTKLNLLWWVVLGYCVGAVAFYRYLIATSQEDPADMGGSPKESYDQMQDRGQTHSKAA